MQEFEKQNAVEIDDLARKRITIDHDACEGSAYQQSIQQEFNGQSAAIESLADVSNPIVNNSTKVFRRESPKPNQSVFRIITDGLHSPLQMSRDLWIGILAVLLWFVLHFSGAMNDWDVIVLGILLVGYIMAREKLAFTPTTNPISPDDYNAREERACRLELCELLGCIGAPFLEAKDKPAQISPCGSQQGAPSEIFNATTPPSDRFSLILELARANIDLLLIFDTVFEIIQVGTALHLGANTKTAERVERALLGRRERLYQQQQRKDDASTNNFPVSFSTMRTLVSQAMIFQAQALESMLSLFDSEGSSFSLLDEEPPVVTLSWLRSSRQHVAETLAFVLGELTNNVYWNAEFDIAAKVSKDIEKLQELQLHLKASIGCQDVSDHERSLKIQPVDHLQRRVKEVQSQLQQLYVALGAMEDASRCQTDTREWWSRVNGLSQEVQDSLNALDREHFRVQEDDTNSVDGDEEISVQSSKLPRQEKSYTLEINETGQQHVPATKTLTKTSVFSGQGALQPPKVKTKPNAPCECEAPGSGCQHGTPQSDPLAQYNLLTELRTRLQTLSLPEEEHQDNNLEDYEIVKSPKAPSLCYAEKTVAIPRLGGLLVSELNNAVKLLGRDSESDGEEDEIEG